MNVDVLSTVAGQVVALSKTCRDTLAVTWTNQLTAWHAGQQWTDSLAQLTACEYLSCCHSNSALQQ